MSHFDQAVTFLLAHEGGFVDDPVDPGGATNFGISLAYLRRLEPAVAAQWDLDHDGDIDAEDIRLLRREDAVEIYRRQWWDPLRYGLIPEQMVAEKLLDLAVNTGPRQAGRIVQRACLAMGAELAVDGAVGPKTRAAISAAWPSWAWTGYRPRLSGNLPGIVAAIRSEAAGFYRLLIEQDPAREKYRRGWERRAYA